MKWLTMLYPHPDHNHPPTTHHPPHKMVIFGGLEFITLKWLGGKMTAALAT
jgi:hypothetical protein